MGLLPLTSRRLRASALALALSTGVLVGGAGAPAPVRASTDNAHNIPGVPLPGPTVSGQLGGSVFDVVYRVVVPPAHILRVSMTGTSGTDFDLYLFDATASNIYAEPPVGLVASSTGPTSTESITYGTAAGGTFYLDLSGATDVEGTYHVVAQVLTDTTPPSVTISLDGGAPATNDPTVTAIVLAGNDLSGIDTMELSQDGISWGAPEPYAATVSWTFTGSDGQHTLWVRIRDEAGNQSAPAHASIIIDRVSPTVRARYPDAGATVASLQPVFSVQFSQPIDASTWLNDGLLLQDAAGLLVYGTYGYDAATYSGTFTPTVPLQPGNLYVVTLGQVTDVAGNHVAPLGSWTVTPLIGVSVSLAASAPIVPRGNAVTLAGQMAPQVTGSLTLEAAIGNGPFVPVVPLITDANGAYAWPAPVAENTSFRVHFGGSSLAAEAFSQVVRVLVRREVALAGVSLSRARTVAANARLDLTAIVTPSDPPVPVTLSIYRLVSGRGYVLQTTVTRTTSAGRHVFSWRPVAGTYRVQLATPPSPLYANGVSATYRWIVR